MKQYELTVVLHPDLEMNIQPALDKIVKLIESVGGKITKETNDGKKRMAYKIAGQEFGVYYYYELDLGVDAPEKLERSLAIADEVIRHLLVLRDERREKAAAKHQAETHSETEEAGEVEGAEESKEEE